MEARRSAEGLKDMQGHLADIDLARRKNMQRMEAGLHELDQRVKHIDKGRIDPDNAALKDITERLNRLETAEKSTTKTTTATPTSWQPAHIVLGVWPQNTH